MKEDDKIYTAEDFASYHNGTMPAKDMHALEKAALEDPFLHDALEGYAFTGAHRRDLDDLQERLGQRKKKNRLFPVFSGARWWRVAALVMAIAGAGYIFYLVNDRGHQQQVAKNQVRSIPDAQSASKAKSDLPGAGARADSERYKLPSSPAREKQALGPLKTAEKEKSSVTSQKGSPARIPPSLAAQPAASDSIGDIQEKKDEENTPALSGKITDEAGNAVPYASVTDKSRNIATTADEAGNFKLPSSDSTVKATAAAAGYIPKNFELDKDVQRTIEIRKNPSSLNEVVVTAMNRKQRAKTLGNAIEKNASAPPTGQARSKAASGDHAFSRYLKENTGEVVDEKGNRVTGEVVLSFFVGKKGRPKKIQVVRSSCDACEPHAVRLLENGPGWSAANDRQTVIIPFR